MVLQKTTGAQGQDVLIVAQPMEGDVTIPSNGFYIVRTGGALKATSHDDHGNIYAISYAMAVAYGYADLSISVDIFSISISGGVVDMDKTRNIVSINNW